MNSMRKIIFAAFLAAAIIAQSVSAFAKDWGLGFDKAHPNSRPVGDEAAEYLKQYDAYYIGADEKTIYLTFDAGYEIGVTGKILDVLKKNEVPAAFFLVSSYLKTEPELVRRMVAEGHIVGNHTMRHPDMSQLGADDFAAQLLPFEKLFTEVTGAQPMKFYRPPMGKYSEANLKQAQSLGYKTIFWSLAYKDYDRDNQPSHEAAFQKLMSRVHPGAVILLHSTSSTNAEILDELIHRYKDLGYVFKSLNELS